ncbi:protein of unknown function DUF330 [Shewanella denitrificans OS217]|jgi:uncharacterized protein|uniref:ABC-type transport auxiliary lipoprotein component domain-containing protein n=1 Tax=Shewanella denitrificans (strain OS217 / ATCC BAA-1090 / DSM 15013) TaxID=318161 RepID=Q12RG9_SHEDO|nr:PqiC family protein [Shewanella denitrificans]ABE53957.1 protein of unknown function DUF330 [Shewanella denitrificans OS217]
MKLFGIMRLTAVLGIFILQAALLTGCQTSPQKNYYVLTSAAPPRLASNTSLELAIGIGPISIPEYLHFTQLVYQTQAGYLHRFDNSYWAEPLDQGINRILGLNLTQASPSRQLVQFPWRLENRPQYSISINILNLNLMEGQASLQAVWTLKDLSSTTKAIPASPQKDGQGQHFQASVPAEQSATGLVMAYSQLLQLLSEQINASLNTLAPN